MSDDVTGLMALVAWGEQDKMLNQNPQHSIFDKPVTRISRSTFTYITLTHDSKDGNTYIFPLNKVAAPGTGEAHTVSHSGFDLIGDCYITLKTQTQWPVTVSFEIKEMEENEWRTLESLDVDAMHAHSIMNPHAFKPCQDQDSTMIPLPFFFTHSTKEHFPMVQKMLFRIVCMTTSPSPPSLTFKAVFLDSAERKEVLRDRKHTKLYTFTTTHKYEAWGPMAAISLRDIEFLVRDLQVIVEDPKKAVLVPEINFTLNGHKHYELSSLMSTQVIPQRYYRLEVSHEKAAVHYLPFCHDPLDPSGYTASVNFSRIDCPQLLLKGLEANTRHTVTIVARHFNTVNFENGMCNIGFAA